MAKIKRKPRNKMSEKNIDLLQPITPMTFEKLGTADDPCFGKHLDPRTPECARCGDSEFCAIMMQQNNAIKRAKVESEGHFKDTEESDKDLADKKLVRKKVKARVRELARSNKKGYPLQDTIDDVHKIFFSHGYTKKRVEKLIRAWAEKYDWLSLSNNYIKFHKK